MEQREFIIKKLVEKLTKGRKAKAQEEIIAVVYGYLRKFDNELLSNFLMDCINGNIWSSVEFLGSQKATNYKLFDYLINEEYLNIIKALMHCKPTLGSPNAKTGDYELMFLVTIPESKKPKKGDIEHPIYGKPNLKGANPRYNCEISGKSLNKKMLEVLNRNNFTPILYNGVLYGQLLNENYVRDDFNPQFINSERKKVEDVLAEWITNLFPSKKLSIDNHSVRNIIESSLDGNCLIWGKWVKSMLVFIFENSKNREEIFMVVSDDGSITHLTQDIFNFKNLVNENKIEMEKDFFRLNQEEKCAVYLKFN